jgi:hypothetical protein
MPQATQYVPCEVRLAEASPYGICPALLSPKYKLNVVFAEARQGYNIEHTRYPISIKCICDTVASQYLGCANADFVPKMKCALFSYAPHPAHAPGFHPGGAYGTSWSIR